MKSNLSVSKVAIVFAGALFAATSAFASPDPVKQHNSNAVWFENWTGLSNATLKVTAPNGEVTTIHTDRGTPVFELERGAAMDGIYRFELSAATEKTEKIINQTDNGRGDDARDTTAVPFNSSGTFTVERGAIITPKEISEQDG